jgi:hypothetical protein
MSEANAVNHSALLEATVKDFENFGCTRVDRMLGFGKMPEGYALMLDSDDMYFFWVNDRGEDGPTTWDKWQARRMAIARERFLSSNTEVAGCEPATPDQHNRANSHSAH